MAEHKSGPLETGAEMDYAEHDKTYHGFIRAATWGSIAIAALLISMAAGFFTAAGFFSSLILFVILTIAGIILIG